MFQLFFQLQKKKPIFNYEQYSQSKILSSQDEHLLKIPAEIRTWVFCWTSCFRSDWNSVSIRRFSSASEDNDWASFVTLILNSFFSFYIDNVRMNFVRNSATFTNNSITKLTSESSTFSFVSCSGTFIELVIVFKLSSSRSFSDINFLWATTISERGKFQNVNWVLRNKFAIENLAPYLAVFSYIGSIVLLVHLPSP